MKKAIVIVGVALCGIGTSTAKAESLRSLHTQVVRLSTKITYAKRFAAHDRAVIRDGYEWVVIGSHVEQLIQHASVTKHREHLRTMLRIVRTTRRQLAIAKTRYAAAALPPHYRSWLCIHSFEGSWTDPIAGDPLGAQFSGGLQFGHSEWMHYGYPWTHVADAEYATPLQQMWAAERYFNTGAGFSPWPKTARDCGLL